MWLGIGLHAGHQGKSQKSCQHWEVKAEFTNGTTLQSSEPRICLWYLILLGHESLIFEQSSRYIFVNLLGWQSTVFSCVSKRHLVFEFASLYDSPWIAWPLQCLFYIKLSFREWRLSTQPFLGFTYWFREPEKGCRGTSQVIVNLDLGMPRHRKSFRPRLLITSLSEGQMGKQKCDGKLWPQV